MDTLLKSHKQILQAWKDGVELERCEPPSNKWKPLGKKESQGKFKFNKRIYRIK